MIDFFIPISPLKSKCRCSLPCLSNPHRQTIRQGVAVNPDPRNDSNENAGHTNDPHQKHFVYGEPGDTDQQAKPGSEQWLSQNKQDLFLT
jgi:hypothetical protein